MKPRKPIVIGAPRTGFTLTIGVTNAILNQCPPPEPPPRELWREALKGMIDLSSRYLTQRYLETFARHGLDKDVVFNGEFHLLVGGPKWLEKDRPERASIRKYFGVKGQGDFLMNTSFPREVLEYNDVIHSHLDPPLWLQQKCYENHKMIASVRNPLGVINSACFSLNAMASEYVQKFNNDDLSQDFIRQRHGLYKLSDLNFVRGLGEFLKKYLEQFLSVRDEYTWIKWEDLIREPGRTIQYISEQIDAPITLEQAEAIWEPMDHVNTLQYHKHNYRRGKGIVGDWKNSMVNEHFEVLKELCFDEYLRELDYPEIPRLKTQDYSPYQKLVASHIQRGDIYHNVGDMDLFGFAFNKSNIDASKYNFRSLPKRDWTHVERTTVKNHAVVEEVSDAAEDGCTKVNQVFLEWIAAGPEQPITPGSTLANLENQFLALSREIQDPQFPEQIRATFARLKSLNWN